MLGAVMDRVVGAVLGSAVGDALGAPYEFGTAVLGPQGPQMIGGGLGGFAPGEWTDDTTMTWCVLEAAAGLDLRGEQGLTRIARNFRAWFESGPADIGNQTRLVLGQVGADPSGATMLATSYDLHARTGHTGGNGSLMRTGPVPLPYLDRREALIAAARAVGGLTHADPRAQQACVLWSLAIRTAIVDRRLDLRSGLSSLGRDAASFWSERIDEAEARTPSDFRPNGWVVTALQAAWSAIACTPVPADTPSAHFADALVAAVGAGDDTDTVAAIAGALLGARWGAAAIPDHWRSAVHGYPGLTGADLVQLASKAVESTR